jgi:transcriptional regulator with XRE-family HTH domain
VNAVLDLVRSAPPARPSPGLGAARVARGLTVEEAARRAGLLPDEVTWLEEGRVYRFRSTDEALAAAVLYAAALGVGHREARRLAGLPRPPLARRYGRGRLAGLAAALIALLALALAVVLPERGGESAQARRPAAPVHRAPALPPPWRIGVDVRNGGGDIVHTRQVASRIGALAYRVERVARADRFDYPQTVVFYERGGQAIAVRLARTLGVVTRPLPGGANPRRLVVIVGPAKGPG